eukprot:Hpha_TRINITY_DN19883_c0_g1::TRINITY_DN19883_c0_g1_i1::g.132113::m.132113/K13299/GSTK1; glutathione S-transferase kappa 1
MPVNVTLYYDCLSPYSFFAFKTLLRYKRVWPMDLVLRPIILGGIMATTGNQPPALRKHASYARKVSRQDLIRNKLYFNVPEMLPMPTNFFAGVEDSPALARDFRYQRFLTAVSRTQPTKLEGVTDQMFDAMYVRQDTRDPAGNVLISDGLFKDVGERGGMSMEEAEKAVQEIGSSENKEVLKAAVAEAIKRGAYGAPFIAASRDGGEEEVVFGSDRFEALAVSLGLPWHGPDPDRPTTTARL